VTSALAVESEIVLSSGRFVLSTVRGKGSWSDYAIVLYKEAKKKAGRLMGKQIAKQLCNNKNV